MNYKDKLPDLIDGNLPLEEEKEIFALLAKDEDLLFEYKALTSIVNTINSNINQYAPSNHVTESIFKQIGIQTDSAAPTLKFIKTNNRFSNTSKVSLALAASFALFLSISSLNQYSILPISIDSNPNQTLSAAMGSSMPQYDDNINPKAKSSIISSRNRITTPLIPSINDANTIAISTIADEFSNLSSDLSPAPNYDNVLVQIVANTSDYSDLSSEAFAYIRQNNNPQNIVLADEVQSNSLDYFYDVSTAPNSPEFIEHYSILDEESFTVELKNSIYFNTKESDKPSAKLNNIGLTILYKINDNFYAGIDLRDESFKMKAKDEAESLTSFNQSSETPSNIALTSIGVAVRYNLKDKEDNFYPSGQVILAKNRDGIVGRLNFGISFKPFPGITTTAGVEYSNLTYSSSNISYNSPKLGFNYGLAYNF